MTTAADLLIGRLVEWGVDTVFGFPGDGINGLMEAMRTHKDKVRFIQVRHEEAAAFAACGYAKYTGRLGVCLATSGPGGIHLLNGLYDAKMDGQPVLAITGHTFHDLIGTRNQQDVDLPKLFMDVAAYSERISGPAHVYNVVDEAIRLALGRRTVAHVNIPKDTQTESTSDEDRSERNVKGHSDVLFESARPLPPPQDLQAAADIINQGKKVVIFAGRGAFGARDELERLAEQVGGPIIKPLLGKAVVPDDSPYTTGGTGLLGTKPSYDAVGDCDTLVMVGTSFPYETFYPKPGQAKAVQIDIDPSRIGLRYPVEVGLPGDSRDVLQALLPLIQRKGDRSFLQKAQDGMKDWWKLMDELGTDRGTPMKPEVVAYELNKVLADDAIIACDTGTVTTWGARYLKMRGTQMFTASGNLATMACALPYAVGAAVAYPGRQVVAFCGDGGFTMLMCELLTIAKYKLPVKVVVIKNNVLGEIKWEQMVMEGNPEYGVELEPLDFAKYAEACGMPGFYVEDPKDVAGALRQAFEHDGPALISVLVDPNEPPMPPHITREQAVNFAESLIEGQPHRWDIAMTAAKDLWKQVV